MPDLPPESDLALWVAEWRVALVTLQQADAPTCQAWLEQHAASATPAVFEQLKIELVQLAEADVTQTTAQAEVLLKLSQLPPASNFPQNRACALSSLGWAAFISNNYGESLAYYDEINTLLTDPADRSLRARLLVGQLSTLFYSSQFETAQALAADLEHTFVAENDWLAAAKVANNVGIAYLRLDQYPQAGQYFERAAQLAESSDDLLMQARIKFNLAMVKTELHDFRAALNLQNQCRSVFEQQGLNIMLAMLNGNQGYIQFRRGEYLPAMQAYERARSFFQEHEMFADVQRCDNELADIYLELNLLQEAIQTYKYLLPYYDSQGQNFEAAKVRCQYGVALARSGRTVEALRLLKRAARAFLAEGNQVWIGQVELYIGELYWGVKNTRRARSYLETANRRFNRLGLERRALQARYQLAQLQLNASDTRMVRLELQELLQDAQRLEAEQITPYIYYALGQVADNDGDSLAFYREAIVALDRTRAGLPDDEFKTAYLRDKIGIFENAFALCLKTGLIEEAFNYAEQAKSRALFDRLNEDLGTSRNEIDSEAAALYEQLDSLRAELNDLYRAINLNSDDIPERNAGPNRLTPAQTLQRLAELEREYTETLRRIRLKAESTQTATHRLGLATVEQVQSWLDDRTSWLQYARAGDKLIAFIVTRKSIQTVTLGEVRRVESVQNLLSYQLAKFKYGPDYVARHRDSLLDSVKMHLGELYQQLIEPLINLLEPRLRPKLVIVPHGSLHLLPFHALYEAKRHRYLLQDFTISYAPSASIQQIARTRSPRRPDHLNALVMGVPDAATQHIAVELKTVGNLLEGSTVLSGDKATIKALRDEAANFAVLHLATHGSFRQDNPLFSALKLADGWLTVSDIYNLRLNAWLVTLSACDTGLNIVSHGDELMGLVRGFLGAGAASLVVSLWALHDLAASQLMGFFYANLRNGLNRAESLRAAQLLLMQEEKYAHPYFWAGLTFIGDM